MIFNHIKQLKADGKKIGITFSTFDMLHAGHIAMLSEAKNHCDYLICGLQTDPTIDRPDTKNHPTQSIVERQIQLAACRYVDLSVMTAVSKLCSTAEITASPVRAYASVWLLLKVTRYCYRNDLVCKWLQP